MNLKQSLKIASAGLLSGVMVLFGGVASVGTVNSANAAGSSTTSDTHHLVFTSDVHGLNNKLETAFNGLPTDTEYVGLIGDMVGAGGGAHDEYDSSTLLNIAQTAFPNIDNTGAAIVWADHDMSVHDDADIVKIWHGFEDPQNGYDSGEILETDDYYLYVIGYYHMIDGGDESKTAAAAFKSWADNLADETKPIIVLGHVPLVAKRGDNNGAAYWNEALNYAATGVEGLNGADTTAEATRNVFYFYGHNHTVDSTEYYYAPGDTMNIQIDTTVPGTEDGLLLDGINVTTTTAFDEEKNANVTAKGIDTKVYYNALITGYIKTSGNATLMTIAPDTITLTKYNDGNKVSLGKGSTGETLGDTVSIPRITATDDDDSDSEIIPLVPNTGRQ